MKEITVYADWLGTPSILKMGTLRVENSKGKETFSFEYETSWLSVICSNRFDPDFKLFSGSQLLNDEKSNFGILLDSSPDHCGRAHN